MGVVGLGTLLVAALVAQWQYLGPDRRSSTVALQGIAVGGAVALAALLIGWWAGDC